MKPSQPFPLLAAAAAAAATSAHAINILQSNDDGWAETNIRTLHATLTNQSHNVILSAPADNKSGSSSLDSPPLPRLTPCQFSSCPAPGPAVATDPENPRAQYVNSFPVTALKAGINDLAPLFFGGGGGEGGQKVQLAVTGPNVGSNLDIQVPFSGTVGAAVEAVKQGIPALAFSGRSGEPTAFGEQTPLYARLYADLAAEVVAAVTAAAPEGAFLPEGVWLNVNFPEVVEGEGERCTQAGEFRFVLSRINPGILSGEDVETCGNGGRLPTERSVVDTEGGCFVSVSVGDAADKTTADKEAQEAVLARLGGFLSCLP